MRVYLHFDANNIPITEQSVTVELEKRGQLELFPGGKSYLTELLCDALSELKHVRYHAELLKHYGNARNLRTLLATTEIQINDPANRERTQSLLDGLAHKVNLLRSGCDLQGNLRPESAMWCDPKPLGGALPPVMECDLDNMLPEVFRDVVLDISHRLQTPPDYAVASAIVTLAGAVNRRADTGVGTAGIQAPDNNQLTYQIEKSKPTTMSKIGTLHFTRLVVTTTNPHG